MADFTPNKTLNGTHTFHVSKQVIDGLMIDDPAKPGRKMIRDDVISKLKKRLKDSFHGSFNVYFERRGGEEYPESVLTADGFLILIRVIYAPHGSTLIVQSKSSPVANPSEMTAKANLVKAAILGSLNNAVAGGKRRHRKTKKHTRKNRKTCKNLHTCT